MASTTTTTKTTKTTTPTKTCAHAAPGTLLEFLQAALFLEDPDLPKEQRISKTKSAAVMLGMVAYVCAVFFFIMLACVTTPVLPFLQSAWAAVLRLCTPPEWAFKTAYHYDGPVVRLMRHLSTHFMSSLNMAPSSEMPALHRLVTQRSSCVAVM